MILYITQSFLPRNDDKMPEAGKPPPNPPLYACLPAQQLLFFQFPNTSKPHTNQQYHDIKHNNKLILLTFLSSHFNYLQMIQGKKYMEKGKLINFSINALTVCTCAYARVMFLIKALQHHIYSLGIYGKKRRKIIIFLYLFVGKYCE